MQTYEPRSVKASRKAGKVTIEWDDGHISVYPFMLLRAACPCATCRGGHEYMTPEPDPEVFDHVIAESPAIHLEKVEAVGSYAVTFTWEDGHHYGIYNWHYLRALCPCVACRKAHQNE